MKGRWEQAALARDAFDFVLHCAGGNGKGQAASHVEASWLDGGNDCTTSACLLEECTGRCRWGLPALFSTQADQQDRKSG